MWTIADRSGVVRFADGAAHPSAAHVSTAVRSFIRRE